MCRRSAFADRHGEVIPDETVVSTAVARGACRVRCHQVNTAVTWTITTLSNVHIASAQPRSLAILAGLFAFVA